MDVNTAPPSPPATLTPNGDLGNKPLTASTSSNNSHRDNDHPLANSTHHVAQPSNFDPSLVSPPSANAPYSTSPDRRPKKSSSTCTTCRARKVRCNGARDVCSNCQRLGFPCSYDDSDSAAWNVALPRRRVKQACQSCHSRKARCSGHVPACDRCRAQGLECVYRPTKRARVSRSGASVGGGSQRQSPDSNDDQMEDVHNDSDPGLTDPGSTNTPTNYNHDVPSPHGSFDALIGSTFEKFFRHVHHIPMYSFLHRASLMEQYHAGKVDRPMLLALIGITSCLTDMGPGMREYGDRCVDEAEQLIFSDYARPSTIKIQALVFMIKHRILSHRFPSAFFLLSLASRYAASLRLNYESPNLCFLAQESRRRLMWSLYCIDAGVSGGFPDFSLWNADAIHVTLPCNERNFEFDLPQPSEKLIPESKSSPHAEDIGSNALHIRIQHIRKKIAEFTKSVLRTKDMHAARMQTRVLTLHQELDDFAAQLPASFQFSEASLRLRAYSPRLCVYVMIHLWWRQCHCDLYRIGLAGLREALPRSVLENLPESFLEHCQRQCVDHATAIANIFSATQKLHVKMAADLDLALCAYQAARILTYAYHTNAEKFDLSADAVLERTSVCVQAIREYCNGKAAHGVKSDLEKLVSQGIGSRASASSRGGSPAVQNGKLGGHARTNSSRNLLRNARGSNGAIGPLGIASLPPAIVADPWSSDNQFSQPDPLQPIQDIQVHRGNGPKASSSNSRGNTSASAPAASTELHANMPDQAQQPQPSTSQPQQTNIDSGAVAPQVTEFNNAYEGALEGLGLDNGLEYAMGVDMNMWVPGNGDWMTPEFMNEGVGL